MCKEYDLLASEDNAYLNFSFIFKWVFLYKNIKK